MAKSKSKSPRRSRSNTKAERGWASAKGSLKRARERSAHLMEGATLIATSDVGARWSGKKQAVMELKNESLTQDIAGRDVDKFIGGGYLAAGQGRTKDAEAFFKAAEGGSAEMTGYLRLVRKWAQLLKSASTP